MARKRPPPTVHGNAAQPRPEIPVASPWMLSLTNVYLPSDDPNSDGEDRGGGVIRLESHRDPLPGPPPQ